MPDGAKRWRPLAGRGRPGDGLQGPEAGPVGILEPQGLCLQRSAGREPAQARGDGLCQGAALAHPHRHRQLPRQYRRCMVGGEPAAAGAPQGGAGPGHAGGGEFDLRPGGSARRGQRGGPGKEQPGLWQDAGQMGHGHRRLHRLAGVRSVLGAGLHWSALRLEGVAVRGVRRWPQEGGNHRAECDQHPGQLPAGRRNARWHRAGQVHLLPRCLPAAAWQLRRRRAGRSAGASRSGVGARLGRHAVRQPKPGLAR
mmetsp:Transcript_18060/g.43069  ORF Transcript_18060/g.43069 Transcript_18060/m.43069 type:complete len:254 (+) Transcript_18060:691-1452(+)